MTNDRTVPDTTRKAMGEPEILFAIPCPSGNQAIFYRIKERKTGSQIVLCQEISPWGTILEKYREFLISEITQAFEGFQSRLNFPYFEDAKNVRP